MTWRVIVVAWMGLLASAQDPAAMHRKEAALGSSLADQIRAQSTTVADPAVPQYLDGLAKRLAPHFGRPEIDWEITAFREDAGGSTHEAIALPGGALFLPRSLIVSAATEDELAGMLAHSMAHVAERHGSNLTSRSPATTGSIPLIFVGGWTQVGARDDTAMVPAGLLPVWRKAELEADRIAIRVMSAAGYDPAALLRYIQRTQPDLPTGSKDLSMLPPREDRIQALQQSVSSAPMVATQPQPGFIAIRDRLRDQTAGNAAPSLPDGPPTLRRNQQQ